MKSLERKGGSEDATRGVRESDMATAWVGVGDSEGQGERKERKSADWRKSRTATCELGGSGVFARQSRS
jgi:hypothetical protein